MRNSVRRFQDSLPSSYTFKPSRESDDVSGCAAVCIGVCACCSSCLLVLLVLLIIVMGICKLVIGGLYLYDCPLEPKLPVYLLVSGALPYLYNCFECCKKRCEMETLPLVCSFLLSLFLLAWLIAGTVFYAQAMREQEACEQAVAAQILGATTPAALNFTTSAGRAPVTTTPATTTTTTPMTTTPTTVVDTVSNTTSGNMSVLPPLRMQAQSAAEDAKSCPGCNDVLMDFFLANLIIEWICAAVAILIYSSIFVLAKCFS